MKVNQLANIILELSHYRHGNGHKILEVQKTPLKLYASTDAIKTKAKYHQ